MSLNPEKIILKEYSFYGEIILKIMHFSRIQTKLRFHSDTYVFLFPFFLLNQLLFASVRWKDKHKCTTSLLFSF